MPGATRLKRQILMAIALAVPLLRVADVGRSLSWYRSHLGFVGDPFPETPPHEYAILRSGPAEIMLRRGASAALPGPRQYNWDVYLRLEGTPLRELYAALDKLGVVTRRLEQMFYGLAEFEITDPDGYILCLSQHLAQARDLPRPAA